MKESASGTCFQAKETWRLLSIKNKLKNDYFSELIGNSKMILVFH